MTPKTGDPIEKDATSKSVTSTAKLVLLIIFAALFVLDLFLVVTGRTSVFDEKLLGLFYGLRCAPLTAFFSAVTFLGNTLTVVVICAVLIALPGRMKVGLPVVIMVVIGWLSQTGLKNLIARPRPDPANWLIDLSADEYFQSFPSGHANVSMILWVALAVLIGRLLISKNRKGAAVLLRVVFALVAVLIGLSRLYLGVHYPTDVFGGWMLALVILLVCFSLYERFWPKRVGS